MPQLRARTAKLSSKSLKSSDTSAPARLVPLGRLVAPHGVRGELRLLPYAFPCQTLQKGLTVWVQDKTGPSQAYTITQVRPHAPCLLVKFQGVDSRSQAQALRNTTLSVAEALLLPLQDGEFYYYQVIGLKVQTPAGKQLGTIAQVFFSGGHDIWVVQRGQEEYLIPVTEEVVRAIDIPGGNVIIEPIAGLLEANQ